MASTFKIAVDKMGATDPYQYIGRKGDIFYDPEFGELRISDGDTPYGAGLQQGIGGSTPTLNQVLQVDQTASLEATFAGGIKINTLESLNDLDPIYFTSNVEIDSTITADQTNFGTLNGLTIPSGPGTIALLSNIAGSGTVLEAVEDDTAPRLGGDLDTRGFVIKNTGTGNGVVIRQDPVGTISLNVQNTLANTVLSVAGDVITLKDTAWPTTDGSKGQVVVTDGAGQFSWEYRNPHVRFYFYNGGSSPGPAPIANSDTLGTGYGLWNQIEFPNSGVGALGNLSPSSADYNSDLSGITQTNGVFSGFEQGKRYHISAEVEIVNTTTSSAIQSFSIVGSNGNVAKGTCVYPGSGAVNNTDPIVVSMSGIFTFENATPTNNNVYIQLNSEQLFTFYTTEAIINIVQIS